MRLALVTVILSSMSVTVAAQTMEQCMREKLLNSRDQQSHEIFIDVGCTTGGTNFVAEWNYQGWRVQDCSNTLCWDAPPGRLIVSSEGRGGSAAGSRHSWSGPVYQPSQGQAARVCYSVYARGPDRDQGARGWQKIHATAVTERILTGDEAIVAATQCAQEIQ